MGGSGAGHGRQRCSRGRGGHAPWAALGAPPSAQPELLEGEASTSSPHPLALTPDPNPNPNPNPNAPWAARRSSKSIAGMHLSTARLSGSSVRTAPHAPSRAHSHALAHTRACTLQLAPQGKAQGAGSHSETPGAWLPQSRAPGAPRGTAAAPQPARRKRWPARPAAAPWLGAQLPNLQRRGELRNAAEFEQHSSGLCTPVDRARATAWPRSLHAPPMVGGRRRCSRSCGRRRCSCRSGCATTPRTSRPRTSTSSITLCRAGLRTGAHRSQLALSRAALACTHQ